MKKLLFIIILSALFFNAVSQTITGTVFNGNYPLEGATIVIEGTQEAVMSDKKGNFSFKNIKEGTYTIIINYIGFKEQKIKVSSTKKTSWYPVYLKSEDIYTEEVVVMGIIAKELTPIAFVNIEKSDIKENNFGQDIPYLLNMTPSMVISSDAGAGVGYSSMRIRGTDMSRINITMDGIPLNNSESHGVWWINMPDFASSIDMVQVQRGVGTSSNGAGAFGANVGFYSKEINTKAYAEAALNYGSFNTQKTTIKVGSGLLNNKFSFDTRISKIHSDGYVDRAYSDLNSVQLTGTYVGKKNLIKFNFLKGAEKTYQAWNGTPKDSLSTATGRTYNPYNYENETDNYGQTHYQLFYKHDILKYLNLNLALHYTKGAGYYEQYKSGQDFSDYGINNLVIGADTITETDLIRQKWLDNDFFGGIYSLNFSKRNINVIIGGAINKYIGDHFGNVIWMQYASDSQINHEYYRNQGNKTDINEYIKVNYHLNKLHFWGDLQFRTVNYTIDGIHDDLIDISQERNHSFFNPKVGLSYSIDTDDNIYFSFATANREPSRSDYKDAAENKIPTPETLYDYELGYNFRTKNAGLNINLYYMDYTDQLILTGEINSVGAAIMTNVKDSYRAGIEIIGGLKLNFFEWNANISLSNNKIQNFTAYVDDYDTWPTQRAESFDETSIAFSPEIVSSSELKFNVFKNFYLAVISKYVGEQYIDNTSNSERMLDAYFVNNIRLNYSYKTKRMGEIGFNLLINNVLNEEYETNAWVYRYYYGNEHYVADGYFPQAGINFLVGLDFRF